MCENRLGWTSLVAEHLVTLIKPWVPLPRASMGLTSDKLQLPFVSGMRLESSAATEIFLQA